MQIRCPGCNNPIELLDDHPLGDLSCPTCGSGFSLLSGAETLPPRPPTQRRLGRFELLDQVGIGQFGSVWKARDTELDRTVAIKIPRAGQVTDKEAEQFLREARTAAQLKHPHIVSTHEVGRQDETIYIVSDFIQGANLSQWLTSQRLTVRESIELCVRLAEALHHAHEARVIHRDLKPANIMIDMQGEPHIMDFGLAKRQMGEITMTLDGHVLGTPAYMSPEQASGEGHAADRRTDIYSLGVILFELLTGERPFRGDERMLIVQILQTEPPSPRRLNSRIPRDLETVTLKCLEKEPSKRYATGQELADDLRRWLRGEPIKARPIGSAARVWRWCRRKPVVAGLITAVALSLLTGMGVSAYFAVEAGRNAEEANRSAAAARANEQLAKENEARANFQATIAEGRAARLRKHQYRFDLQRAQATLDRGDRDLAQAFLELCPRQHRHWEWYRLQLIATSEPETESEEAETQPIGVTVIETPSPVWDAEWSPSGEWLAVCGGEWNDTERRNPFLLIWNRQSGQSMNFEVAFQTSAVDLAWSPDSKLVAATSSHDAMVEVWDVVAGRRTSRFQSGGGNGIAWRTSDSKLLTSSGLTARVFNGLTGKDHSLLEARGRVLSCSPDGTRIAVASSSGEVSIGDAATGRIVTRTSGHSTRVNRLAWSPDNLRIATASSDHTTRVWNAESGNLELELRNSDTVNGLSFSPDGRRLLTTGVQSKTELSEDIIWDTSDGTELYRLPAAEHPGGSAAWHPDGRLLAIGYEWRYVKVWDSVWPISESDRKREQESALLAEVLESWMDTEVTSDAVAAALENDPRLTGPLKARAKRLLTAHAQSPERSHFLKEEVEYLDTLLGNGTADWRMWDRRGRCAYEQQLFEAAESDFSRSIDLGATDPWVWFHRGRCRETLMQWEQAANDYREAIQRDSAANVGKLDRRTCLLQLAACQRMLKQWESAGRTLTTLIDAGIDDDSIRLARAAAFIELGQFQSASLDLERVMELQAGSPESLDAGAAHDEAGLLAGDELTRWHRLALFQLKGGDEQGYRRTCRHVLERYRQSSDELNASRAALICSLGTNESSLRQQAVELAETMTSDQQTSYNYEHNAALALFRADEYETSHDRLTRALSNHASEHSPNKAVTWDPTAFALTEGGHPEDWLLMAMLNDRLGRYEAAQKWLDKASQWIEYSDLAEQHDTVDWKPWMYQYEWEVLLKEAKALIPPLSNRPIAPGDAVRPLVFDACLQSDPISLDGLRGRVVLLEFWGVFCPPCIRSIPTVRRWHETYGPRGLQIVGVTKYYGYRWETETKTAVRDGDITTQDERAALSQFAAHHQMTYPIGIVSDHESYENYQVRGIPHYVVIDQQGTVRLVHTGSDGLDEIETLIASLLDVRGEESSP